MLHRTLQLIVSRVWDIYLKLQQSFFFLRKFFSFVRLVVVLIRTLRPTTTHRSFWWQCICGCLALMQCISPISVATLCSRTCKRGWPCLSGGARCGTAFEIYDVHGYSLSTNKHNVLSCRTNKHATIFPPTNTAFLHIFQQNILFSLWQQPQKDYQVHSYL